MRQPWETTCKWDTALQRLAIVAVSQHSLDIGRNGDMEILSFALAALKIPRIKITFRNRQKLVQLLNLTTMKKCKLAKYILQFGQI